MIGFRLNPDKDYVSKIIEGTLRKDGHCPCRTTTDETTLCPCNEFIFDGVCKCKLFVPIK